MKKYLLLLIFLLLIIPVNADSWDDIVNVDRMWDGQKSITNKEFEQVVEKLEENKAKKEEKQKKKRFKKLFGTGNTLHEELNPDDNILEMDSIKPEEQDLLVNLPVDILLDGKALERGYYRVEGVRDQESKKVFLKFYQSQFLKGELEVIETKDDFEQDRVDFVKVIPYNDSFIKIIFGSLEFNAYNFIPYLQEK